MIERGINYGSHCKHKSHCRAERHKVACVADSAYSYVTVNVRNCKLCAVGYVLWAINCKLT